VLDIDKEVLITHIFNSTDKGMSMDKATKYALQLRVIAQESYPIAQQLDYFENIHSIPGIGKLSTAMIIGEIGDIKRFKSNKQLNA
ncbi:IS110 family transposase, partial [Staphylococcus epidermidis]